MRAKLLRSGNIAYFWEPPTWARRAKCPLAAEALGVDFATAKQRCDTVLNPQFRAWRTKDNRHIGIGNPVEGSFDWAAGRYKSMPKYARLSEKSKKDYDRALSLVSSHKLTDGRTFGTVSLRSITPGIADRLFAALSKTSKGGTRYRTAVMCMAVTKVMWNVAFRDRPDIVPATNPFAKLDMSAYQAQETRPVTLDELWKFVRAADENGERSIGTAMMIAYFWQQRQIDILRRLQWTAYRPKDAPELVRIFHHKTGAVVPLPLFDEDGTALWPELMDRLDAATRNGTLMVMRDKPDRKRKIHLPWTEHYFRHRVAEIRELAGIDPDVKFMGLRHGGNTAAGDADLTDAQIRALSGHKTASMTSLYTKQTLRQRRAGARKLLAARTKRGSLSE